MDTTESLMNLTTTMATTTTVKSIIEEPLPTDILQSAAEFEIILPCIFGIFVALSLSLIVFYSKRIPYEIFENVKEQSASAAADAHGEAYQMRDMAFSGFASPVFSSFSNS